MEITKEVKKIDHRLNTLDTHLAHVETWSAYEKYSKKCQSLPVQKQVAFRERYKVELDEFKIANDYLTGVLNGRIEIPVEMWQNERKKLSAERFRYGERYYKLYKDISVIENIRKSAEVYINTNMPDAKRPELVKSVPKVAPKPVQKLGQKTTVQKTPEQKLSIRERLSKAKTETKIQNTERSNYSSHKRNRDFDR